MALYSSVGKLCQTLPRNLYNAQKSGLMGGSNHDNDLDHNGKFIDIMFNLSSRISVDISAHLDTANAYFTGQTIRKKLGGVQLGSFHGTFITLVIVLLLVTQSMPGEQTFAKFISCRQ